MIKTVLITGASTGIGRASAKYFFDQGWNVVATLRSPDLEKEFSSSAHYVSSGRMLCIALDVTQRNSIEAAFQKAKQKFGSIDVVVNNAGYGLTGVFEGISPEQIDRQFKTNVIGLMDVCRLALQFFREAKKSGGVIINVASVAGRISVPLFSPYNATKWAVEGFSESLQYEANCISARVKIIEPGVVVTDFYTRSADRPSQKVPVEYEAYAKRINSTMDARSHLGATANDVAKVIYRAATDPSRRLRYAVGLDAHVFLFLRRFLPDAIGRLVVALLFR